MADTPNTRLPRKPGKTTDGRSLKQASAEGPVRSRPKPTEAPANSRSLSRAVSPPPVTESRALTAPGGAAPPPRPPTGTSVMAPGASAPPPSTGGAASRSLALRQMELGSPRGLSGRTAGNLAALGAAGAGALYDNVRENYPRVQREEIANSAAEGISTRAFDAPARVPGRTPALVARRGGANGVPARDPVAAGLDNGAELGPRGSAPTADRPGFPDSTRPINERPRRPAPRPMRDERDNSADDLNRLELARIDRVGRGMEADRPPQFAKGGMVAKKGVNPFAAASKAAKPASSGPLFGKAAKAPSANPFAAPSKVGKAGRPAGPPSAPPVPKAKAPKVPKMPGLPFAKGGMPKKPKGC